MNTLHNPELEAAKRSIDLVDYAKRAGYVVSARDGVPGVTVLEHPNRDRIAVGQSPLGPWIYASVPEYAPRGAEESRQAAFERLKTAIRASRDRGTLVEFVRERDPARWKGEVSIERVSVQVAQFRSAGRSLDFEGALHPPPYGKEREAPARGLAAEAQGRAALNERRYDWSPPVAPGRSR